MFDHELFAGGDPGPTPIAQAGAEERTFVINAGTSPEQWEQYLDLNRAALETQELYLVVAERQARALERIAEMLELGVEKLDNLNDKLRALNTSASEIRDNLL